MIYTILALIILGSLSLYYWLRSEKKMSVGLYLLIIYCLSIFSTFILGFDDVYSLKATLYFLLILILFLFPILKFNSSKIINISPVNYSSFRLIGKIFIIFGFVSYIYFLPIVIKLFLSGESILILRTNMVGGEIYFNVDFKYYLITLFCQFYPIVLGFYFYSISFMDNSKLFNKLLLFSSTAYIINVLASVGRDGFVLWSMSYLFTFILFSRFLKPEVKRKNKRLMFILLGLFSLIFIPITIARFVKDGDAITGVVSLFDYFGQQFGNFNSLFNTLTFRTDIDSYKTLFPIFSMGEENKLSLLDRRDQYLNLYQIDVNIFSSFIGDFFLNIGAMPLFFISIIFSFISSILLFRNKTISFGQILLIILIGQIPLHGLFYYKLGYLVSNIYMILTILLAFYFWKINKAKINAK